MNIIDFGIEDYGSILNLQRNLFQEIIEKKVSGKSREEYLLIGEHPPVITCGRHHNETNILYPREFYKSRNIEIYEIERGGDVTYHCEGQLILYPIIDMTLHHLGVKRYVDLLEESVIRLLKEYGLKGERIEGATGVWLGKNTESERKISAIGVKCSHYCTMHGLSLNVNSELSGFSLINPCGFTDKGVTSIKKELNREISMDEVKEKISDIFLSLIFSL